MNRIAFTSALGSALAAIALAPFVATASGCASSSPSSGEDTSSTSAELSVVCGAPSGGPVQGYDVSVYQGGFDWNAAKQQGRAFGYARVSDGLGTVDQTFAGNWAGMKAAGILRGAYQFFEPGEDEAAEADLLVQKVGGKLGEGDLPAMIDVEVTGGVGAATMAAKILHWLQIVEAGTGKRPVIYTGAYFWQDHVGATTFGGYPLVIAAYGPVCPSVPTGWSTWTFWQYSDGGGALDHDVFNGSLSALQAFAGGGAVSYPAWHARTRVDTNGDGDADLCARGAGGVVCQTSNGTAFPDMVQGPGWSDAKGWSRPEYGSTVQFGDVNGDGKADVCGRAALGFLCELGDGTAFPTEIPGPALSDANGWAEPQYYATIQLADVDGDGKLDVCARAAAGVSCWVADGTGFPTEIEGPAWSDAAGWDAEARYTTIHFPDVNGDGKADVCGRGASGVVCALSDGKSFGAPFDGPAWSDAGGWTKPEYDATLRWADVDGDGKADVCGRAADGLHCALSQGTSFAPDFLGPAWSDANGWNKPEYFSTIRFADVNGDGKADACARAAAGVVCDPSNGTSFGAEIAGPAWSDAAGWNKAEYYSTIEAGDVNKDGMDDLCARSATGMVCAPSTGNGFGPTFDGPAWSDKEGWSADAYYPSVRLLGVASPTGKPGGTGGTAPNGGSSTGNGAPADEGMPGNEGAGSCACETSGAPTPRGTGALGAVAAALAVLVERRRRSVTARRRASP